jgi:hypothetical protein
MGKGLYEQIDTSTKARSKALRSASASQTATGLGSMGHPGIFTAQASPRSYEYDTLCDTEISSQNLTIGSDAFTTYGFNNVSLGSTSGSSNYSLGQAMLMNK